MKNKIVTRKLSLIILLFLCSIYSYSQLDMYDAMEASGVYKQFPIPTSSDKYIIQGYSDQRTNFEVGAEQIRMYYNPKTAANTSNTLLSFFNAGVVTDRQTESKEYAEEGELSSSSTKLVHLTDLYAKETNELAIAANQPSGLRLNVYYPKVKTGRRATDLKLPVIVYGYGCGFIFRWDPNGNQAPTPQWLAAKGFIVIVPEYRIGINLRNRFLGGRPVWRATQDIRKVIRLCRTSPRFQTEKYAIDLSKPVIYMGYSAGAIAGISNVYYTDSNKLIEFGGSYIYKNSKRYFGTSKHPEFITTYDLGGLDDPKHGNSRDDFNGKLTNVDVNLNVQDITVAVSGGIGSVSPFTTNPTKEKALMLIHDKRDGMVPCGNVPFTLGGKEVFRDYNLFNKESFEYPYIYGSCAINDYFITNPRRKPDVFLYKYIDPNCTTDDCIIGNAGGPTEKTFETFYHLPLDHGISTKPGLTDADRVLIEILKFLYVNCLNVRATPIPTTYLPAGYLAREIVTTNSGIIKPVEQTLTKQDPANLTIYPNPVSGDFMNITAIDNNTPYAIYNTLGQEVNTGKVNNGTINVANLSNGTYLLQLQVNDQRIVKRFIKQ
jgi:Secretion system C-terminal sorting domain